jgi:parallel beta-helix repeat protein
MRTESVSRLIGLVAALVGLEQATVLAQSTAFTYQGRLHQADQPADGLFDFRFALFESANGEELAASPITNTAVTVRDGFFTVLLDFGLEPFNGQPRWLEIAVRPSGAPGSFTVLSPRQPLTPSPYALTAVKVSGPVLAAQLAGPLGSDQLAGVYANALSLIHPSNYFVGLFHGDGSGLTNLNWTGVWADPAQAHILWVAPWGDDSRAERGRLDRPWGSWSNAVACARNGQVVCVLPGRYTNLHRSDFYLTGEANVLVRGKTNLVIEGLGYPTLYNPNPAVLMAIQDCSNVVVRGLAFESENSNHWPTQPLEGGVFGHLVYVHCAALTIEDCLFTKGVDHGVLEPAQSTAAFELRFASTNQIVIRRNRFSSFGHWTLYKPAESRYWDGAAIVCGAARVEGNEIIGCARGIEVYSKEDGLTPGAYILNNRIRNTLDFGIGVFLQNSGATVLHNDIIDEPGFTYLGSNQWPVAAGIELAGASDCLIMGNRIEGKVSGIAVHEGGGLAPARDQILYNTVRACRNGIAVGSVLSSPASNNVVVGNHISLCSHEGIVLSHAVGTTVRGNWIIDPSSNGSRSGIILFDGCDQTVLTDNFIADSAGGRCVAGITFLDTSAQGAMVAANQFVGITNAIEGSLPYDDYAKSRSGAVVAQQFVWATNGLTAPASGVVAVPFDGPAVQWISFTNTVLTLTTTNRHVPAPRTVELWLAPTGSAGDCIIYFQPQWRRFSGSLQNDLSPTKLAVVRLRLLASGGDESTVAVWWEPEF